MDMRGVVGVVVVMVMTKIDGELILARLVDICPTKKAPVTLLSPIRPLVLYISHGAGRLDTVLETTVVDPDEPFETWNTTKRVTPPEKAPVGTGAIIAEGGLVVLAEAPP